MVTFVLKVEGSLVFVKSKDFAAVHIDYPLKLKAHTL